MGKPLRSALEIAMDRFQTASEEPSLTEEQKVKLQELQRQHDAKTAEKKIMAEQSIAGARASGDLERAAEIQSTLALELRGLQEKLEREKNRIRSEA